MGSLQAHERTQEKNEEIRKDTFTGIGYGRAGFHGKGCDRGRGRCHFNGQGRQSFSAQKVNKKNVKCYNWKQFGHVKSNCWNQASYVEEESQESKLFMAHIYTNEVSDNAWFVDSGCLNHTTYNKSPFKELRDKKRIQVDGKDTIAA